MLKISVNVDSRIPKYRQIVDSILQNIKNGTLALGDKIPSINQLSETYQLSRDTVEKAYVFLKEQNIIVAVKGKGYYVSKTDLSIKLNVFFLINKLSTYKMRIYNSFVQTLGANVNVDLDIYHCDPIVFAETLKKKKHLYDFFIIMPHFRNEKMQHIKSTAVVQKSIETLDYSKLIFLDRNVDFDTIGAGKVVQDFKHDIYSALETSFNKLKKYKKIILVYPSKAIYPYPQGIVLGFKHFCVQHKFNYEILDEIYDGMEFELKDLFIIIEESDLVNLVTQARERHYKLGEDIGIISYNDTPLKKLLDISVFSTDFVKMGKEAANMILNGSNLVIKNDFNFIDRHSH